jgi:hypothetical protein
VVIHRLFSGASRRSLGVVRALALCSVVLAATATFGLRQAQAQLGESLLAFGDQILQWEGARPHSGVRTMHVNGARFRMLSMSFDETITETLDRFETDCERDGGLLSDLDLSPTKFREDASDEGVLACLDTKGRRTVEELMARLERFTETGDLNDVGSFRYVVARRSKDATTALVLWTEGAVPLKDMFPQQGDAPGVDPKDMPRMPGTRRLLSAAESDQPYSATLYRSPPDVDALTWYAGSLQESGWTILKTKRPDTFFASRGDQTVLVRWEAKGRTIGILQLS